MQTWDDLRRECVQAAFLLRDSGKWRSALSRSYYAVFAEVSRLLAQAGVRMKQGREGPAHAQVPALVQAHLGRHFSKPELWRLIELLKKTYQLRELADYRPSVGVDRVDCLSGLSYQVQALAILGRCT